MTSYPKEEYIFKSAISVFSMKLDFFQSVIFRLLQPVLTSTIQVYESRTFKSTVIRYLNTDFKKKKIVWFFFNFFLFVEEPENGLWA